MRNRDGLRATMLAVAASSSVASVALGFAAIVIARALGPEGRGVFAADYSLLFVLVIVGSLGIGPGGRRLLAIGPQEGATLREFRSAMYRLLVVQAALASIAAFTLLPIFGAGRSTGEQLGFVACCVCTLALVLSRESLFGLGGAAAAEAILAMVSVATLGSVVALAVLDQMSVTSVLVVYAAWAFAGGLASSKSAGKRSHARSDTVRAGSAGKLIRSGRPVLVLLIAQAIATRGDRLVIGAIAGPSELGQYAVAVSVMELLSVGALALANVAFQGLANGSLPPEIMVRARRMTMASTAIAATALIVVSPWLIGVAFGREFDDAVVPLQVLAIAAVPFSTYQIDTQHLIARGRARTAASLASWSAGAMVIGDLAIVPIWGVVGAAWLSVVVFAVSAILARRVVNRYELAMNGAAD